MSHFTVLVVGDVENQMAKYDENKRVDPYPRYTRESAAKKLADSITELETIIAGNEADRYNIPYCIERLETLKSILPNHILLN